METGAHETPAELKRSLSTVMLTLYGVGVTVGAGIYALIGEVAGIAGLLAPLAFLAAAAIAALTAWSYARLGVRFPFSAGEAAFVRLGLGVPRLGLVVGLMVALSGTVSAGAIVIAGAGYIREFLDLPAPVLIVAVLLIIGLVAAIGITESVVTASIFTILEVGTLVVVIVAAGWGIEAPERLLHPLTESGMAAGAPWGAALISGAFLAFFAFIGFEDMVNVAEEVQDVGRSMPRAILATLLITGLIYALLAGVAVLAVPPAELAASPAPVALLFERGTGMNAQAISAVAVFAILNGALIQTIMVSRVLYGLARQGDLPALFGRVHPRTRTPVVATAFVIAVIMALALFFPITGLANATSLVALGVFLLVNLSLAALQWREEGGTGLWRPQRAIPLLGAASCAGFVLVRALFGA